jgi:hypothetical protein
MAALPKVTMNPRSSRGSARLRGADLEDVWQEIPPEWLHEDEKDENYKDSTSHAANGSHVQYDEEGEEEADEEKPKEEEKDDPFGSDGSALTDLSELTDLDSEPEDNDKKEEVDEDEDDEEVKPPPQEEDNDPPLPEGFIEWETVGMDHYVGSNHID